MLKEFLDFNKMKFLLMLKWTSVILAIITLVVIFTLIYFGFKIETKYYFSILVFTSVFIPIYCMTLGTLKVFYDYKKTRKMLGEYPFKELLNYGLKETFVHQESKWNYTQYQLMGEFENYPMLCDVIGSKVRIMALADVANIKKEHRKRLSEEFGRFKMGYYWYGVGLTFSTSKKRPSKEEMLIEIKRLVNFLKKENLVPIK